MRKILAAVTGLLLSSLALAAPPLLSPAELQAKLGDANLRNVARSGFGETHYLEDLNGDRLFSIAHIEAFFNVFPQSCRSCAAFEQCPGVAEDYLRLHGAKEFTPLLRHLKITTR